MKLNNITNVGTEEFPILRIGNAPISVCNTFLSLTAYDVLPTHYRRYNGFMMFPTLWLNHETILSASEVWFSLYMCTNTGFRSVTHTELIYIDELFLESSIEHKILSNQFCGDSSRFMVISKDILFYLRLCA